MSTSNRKLRVCRLQKTKQLFKQNSILPHQFLSGLLAVSNSLLNQGNSDEFDIITTLDSGINIGGYAYYFLDFFPGAMFLIREGNAYFFSKYLLFYGMEDACFKSYA